LIPVSLATSHGFNTPEIRDIERLVKEHCAKLIAAYNSYHAR
jgi:hypothetical protein